MSGPLPTKPGRSDFFKDAANFSISSCIPFTRLELHPRLEYPNRSCTLVAVVGSTGSGKSQFIRDVADSHYDEGRDKDLLFPTSKCTYETHISGRQITFIDTPGFDSLKDDEETVFEELTPWLTRKYGSKVKVAGIIYMQNILNDKLYNHKFNFDGVDKYLRKLCGPEWPKRMVLVCSHWDVADDPESMERKLRIGYWMSMRRKGASMERYGPPGARERALKILSRVID